jgi:hypothetical protein
MNFRIVFLFLYLTNLVTVPKFLGAETLSEKEKEKETYLTLPFPDLRDLGDPEENSANRITGEKAMPNASGQGISGKTREKAPKPERKPRTQEPQAKSEVKSLRKPSGPVQVPAPSKPNPKENFFPDSKASFDPDIEDKEDLVPPERDPEYIRAMESIRNLSQSDPDKANLERKKWIARLNNPKLQNRLRMELAWSHFHKKDYIASLEALLEILKQTENRNTKEFATSLYLAGRIHESNWPGQNRSYARIYYGEFLKAYRNGLEAYAESLYLNEVQSRIQYLPSGNPKSNLDE